MSMKRWSMAVLTLALALAAAAPAGAQGGGASSTGTIQGRVSDAQGAVLPGVTVTATSPSLIGEQTTVSSETGNYRFPAVPPGTYTLTFELAGFNTLRREGVLITLGFTANLNVELALATLQETVTVTGESPIIDTTSTRVQQNFKVEQLQSLPNGRDMWSLLAVTPAVQMARIDVGGNRAGTQTDYNAYGTTGQVRVLIEGINTTEGTGGAGFYFDYSSLEEVFMGTTGQTAEMPNPGVQSQFIAKSGGNTFSGEAYLDWYNNSLQGSNIPDEIIARGVRPGSNEMQNYYDTAVNLGGPIKRDKIWWFGTYRTQENKVQQPNFTFDQTFDTKLWNVVGKGTYQLNQKNKIIGYYQWGQKIQPTRLPFGTYTYNDLGPTNRQDSGSWVWKGEWNGTITEKMYVEARFGDFGYYFPQITNGTEDYFWRDTGAQLITGAHQRQQNDRDRKQLTGAATYFLDTGKGSHTFKFGGELLWEQQWIGSLQNVGGNIDHQYANGNPDRLIFYFPTATEVGSLKTNDNGGLLGRNGIDQQALFITDAWSIGRLTMNIGVRWDRYNNYLPEQRQLAGSFGVSELTIADRSFAQRDVNTWNAFAPRAGVVFDLTGDGKMVVKANYGLFWHNPGVGLSSNVNPNQSTKSITYGWNDANGDRRWQAGEQTNLIGSQLEGAISKDPNLKQPYTHEVGVFLERQLSELLGARVGYVYKTEDDLFAQYSPGRGISAYTVPYSFVDIGPDGLANTGDERTLTLLGVPATNAATLFPVNTVIMNTGELGRYKTAEASVTKRYGNRWSASLGGSYSIRDNYPFTPTSATAPAFPNTPNSPGRYERTFWDFKVAGTYDAMWGIRLSPVLRHQSGAPYAREISVPASAAAAAGAIFTGVIYADEPKDNRRDNIWVFDVRAEKTIPLGGRARVRAFLDLFNIGNSSAAEELTVTTGVNYRRPSAILAPRTARVGFRFLF
jgi:hypothetical protein